MTDKPIGYDLYFGVTTSNGRTRIEHARVWDGQKFLEAQREAGAKASNPEDRFTISSATRADYLASRRGK